MLMRLTVAGLRPRLMSGASERGSVSVDSSTTPSAPISGVPVAESPLVVSTFVAFLGAVEGDTQQVHLAEHFLGAAEHGASALALGHHEQQRIELRREREHVIRRQ